MTVNVEVSNTGGENNMNVIRKFTRRMQSTGIVRHMRGKRYKDRALSKTVQKKQALRRIERQKQYDKLLKEGKISETPVRGGRR